LAMLMAIRRTSWHVSRFISMRRPGSSS
jgi:hypothetical protein